VGGTPSSCGTQDKRVHSIVDVAINATGLPFEIQHIVGESGLDLPCGRRAGGESEWVIGPDSCKAVSPNGYQRTGPLDTLVFTVPVS
jgi:hypothetical protein